MPVKGAVFGAFTTMCFWRINISHIRTSIYHCNNIGPVL